MGICFSMKAFKVEDSLCWTMPVMIPTWSTEHGIINHLFYHIPFTWTMQLYGIISSGEYLMVTKQILVLILSTSTWLKHEY